MELSELLLGLFYFSEMPAVASHAILYCDDLDWGS